MASPLTVSMTYLFLFGTDEGVRAWRPDPVGADTTCFWLAAQVTGAGRQRTGNGTHASNRR